MFFKTLEQVQGEECDELIISFGYAKNKSGEFHLRFGPLNQKNGIKRLNVLLTRAIERLDFFTSVKASDFSISANEAINLLRLYLSELEEESDLKRIFLPFNLKTIPEDKTLKISQIHQFIPNIGELKTFHEVMELRGWNLEYLC